MIPINDIAENTTVYYQVGNETPRYGSVVEIIREMGYVYVHFFGDKMPVCCDPKNLHEALGLDDLYHYEVHNLLNFMIKEVVNSRDQGYRKMTRNLETPECEMSISNDLADLPGYRLKRLVTHLILVGKVSRTEERYNLKFWRTLQDVCSNHVNDFEACELVTYVDKGEIVYRFVLVASSPAI